MRVVEVSLVPTDVDASAKWCVVNLSGVKVDYLLVPFIVKCDLMPRPPTGAVPFVSSSYFFPLLVKGILVVPCVVYYAFHDRYDL